MNYGLFSRAFIGSGGRRSHKSSYCTYIQYSTTTRRPLLYTTGRQMHSSRVRSGFQSGSCANSAINFVHILTFDGKVFFSLLLPLGMSIF